VVGQIASGVAHDFNNLLAMIAGSLELAEQRIQDEPARALVRRALESAEVGGSFTRRLLSLARRRKLEPQRLLLTPRIAETMKLLPRALGEHIAYASELATDLWPAFADPGEVDSALLNLAINARDAMPKGGKLLVATMNVSLDAAATTLHPDARPGDYVRLSVVDSGAGMSPETLRRAFEPFFTTKDSRKGTGLGLSSVADFAKQSDGFVTIASEEGKGTTVAVYLRRAAEEPAAVRAATGAAHDPIPRGEGELVLVVDDDDHVRFVTMKRLEALGYKVIEARSGPEAVERLQANHPVQIVLSDVIMPGRMNGYDVARWVLSAKPGIKVVLTSGYSDREPGADGADVLDELPLLGKPCTREHLARTLREVLGKAASARGSA
jgi:two-component system CheB/CheR fusion protein